ncbi:MAG TPA: MFS transporter [Ornithinimicrobium sp.]|uniref:MFS transporter n=1 Tax=Ornithinimicrobium sp. TaxID=1977084 RepID=UPI002B4940AF|nr:MFS transporter [Ornithinimicrobium sp.]HKJ11440.1 MFS transporter [Ornithinimicrobium sp.]
MNDVSPASKRPLLLGVIALALMMVVSAVSGLNVALPDLAVDTGATQTQVTWIVDAYTLAFVALLLPAGAIGDRFGRKGVLMAGLVVFGGAAAVALFVSDPTTLIATRAVMGVGAAAVMPVTLSIITTSFPEEERGRAVGVWVGVAGGGAVLGLFASGILLEFFAWNSFFALNVVLATLALIGTMAVVPASRDDQAPRLDVVGALLAMVGLVGLVLGIIEGAERGWSDQVTVVAFGLSAAGLVGFVLWEMSRSEPLLDPRLFGVRGFGMGSLTLTAQFFGAFGFFFIALQYLQYVVGLSPLLAACAMLPMPFTLIPLARNAPRIADRFGTNRVTALGLTLSATGLLGMSFLGVDFAYWQFAAALVLFAAGMGLAGTPATSAITGSLPRDKQGVASAMNDVSRELGSALGIAVLGSALSAGYREGMEPAVAGLSPELAERVQSSIAFTEAGSQQLSRMGPAGEQLIVAAQQSFVDAIGLAFLIAAVTLAVSAVVVGVAAPRHPEVASSLVRPVGAGAEPGTPDEDRLGSDESTLTGTTKNPPRVQA